MHQICALVLLPLLKPPLPPPLKQKHRYQLLKTSRGCENNAAAKIMHWLFLTQTSTFKTLKVDLIIHTFSMFFVLHLEHLVENEQYVVGHVSHCPQLVMCSQVSSKGWCINRKCSDCCILNYC